MTSKTCEKVVLSAACDKFEKGILPKGDASHMIYASQYYKAMYERKILELTAQAEGYESHDDQMASKETFCSTDLEKGWKVAGKLA